MSFDANTSPDRISALFAYEELKKLAPNRKMRMLCADYEIENVIEKYGKNINELIYPKNSHMDFNIACALFLAAKSEDTL